MGEMFKQHHYAQELYFARLTAAVVNTHAEERSDRVKIKDLLSEDHPARDQMGMTKERLKANYKRFKQNHPEKVPD